MPILSMFYGVVVYMYFFDTQRHHSPHFHVEYAEFTAVIDIYTCDVLDGDLPCNKMTLVQAWLEIHRDEIVADWSLAVRGLPHLVIHKSPRGSLTPEVITQKDGKSRFFSLF